MVVSDPLNEVPWTDRFVSVVATDSAALSEGTAPISRRLPRLLSVGLVLSMVAATVCTGIVLADDDDDDDERSHDGESGPRRAGRIVEENGNFLGRYVAFSFNSQT